MYVVLSTVQPVADTFTQWYLAQDLGDSRGAPSRCSARSSGHVHVVGYMFENVHYNRCFDAEHVSMRDERGARSRHLDDQRRAPDVHT